jgi:soluble lytic murein transglycosylase-like protein
VDGLSAVQSRIAQIQSMFAAQAAPASASGGDWAAVAATSGLLGADAAAAGGSAAGSSGAGVVADAEKYLGVPYRWGGTDPSTGLDCSGLTRRVYADLGVDLPRTAAQQATAGTAVASLADARPGDLVFFDYSSSRAGVDHVGIYIGGGQMIAAPQEGESVKVQRVGTPTLIRRILPDSAAGASSASASSSSASAVSGLAGVPFANLFAQAGARYGVDPSLLAAVASQESGFDAGAVSPAGAEGLMQFMPATARGLGVDPLDPTSSVNGAAKYLSGLQDRFGSTALALAAYNAGPGAVSRYGGIPPYAETQNYVRSVLSKAEAYS